MAVSIEYMAVVVLLRAVAISIRRSQALLCDAFRKSYRHPSLRAPTGPWRWRGPTCYSEWLFTCISIVLAV